MRKGLTIALFFLGFCGFAQERLQWSALEEIDFTEVYDEGTASWVQVLSGHQAKENNGTEKNGKSRVMQLF